MNNYLCIAPDVKLGGDVKLSKFINLYGCEIGDDTKIGAFVEVQKNANIGKSCKISSHTFICEGVTIEDNVFVGHGVVFINDSYPRATTTDGELQTEADWKVESTLVKQGASIGSGATILANLSHRRKRHGGSGQRGDQRCSSEQHCGRQSGQDFALYRADFGGHKMSGSHNIPFLDLVTPHRELEAELTASVSPGPAIRRDSSAGPWWKNLKRHLPPFARRAIPPASAAAPMPCALPSWRLASSPAMS